MKKILLGLLFIGLTSHSVSLIKPQEKVYICVSSSAYAYHQYINCNGLNKCTHTIKFVTENEAINTYGRRKCKICY
jgi:hypothetical protein